MAAVLAKISLLAAGAAAWDDSVVLMQRLAAEAEDTWAEKDRLTLNETYGRHGSYWKLSRQEELLAMGDTGSWCLTDTDSAAGISGCVGTPKGQACTRCVNGMVTCSYGTTPMLDYHGKTYCATADRKAQCFQKGCVPGGCCQQTCCPPKLAKPMKLLITDQKHKTMLAANAAIRAKEAEVKAIGAEIKKENAEFELAKLQAPKVIPRERKAQQDKIKGLKDEIKYRQGYLKKFRADIPANLHKAKKEQEQHLKDMALKVKDMKSSLDKAMANPMEQTRHKKQELSALKQQIKAAEGLYAARQAADRKRLVEQRLQEKEIQKQFSKKLAVDQNQVAVSMTSLAAMDRKRNELKTSQSHIRALEADMVNARKLHNARVADTTQKLKALDQVIARDKLKVRQAAFNPTFQTKKGAEKLKAIKGGLSRMEQERSQLSQSSIRSQTDETAKLQRMEKSIAAEKTGYQKRMFTPAAMSSPAARQSAKVALEKDRVAFKQWKDTRAAQRSKEANELKGIRSAIEAKRSQLQKASLKPSTAAQDQMRHEILKAEKATDMAKRHYAAAGVQKRLAAADQVKEVALEIREKRQKLLKSKAQAHSVVKRRTKGQLSDLTHMLHDIKDKSKVLVAKQIELEAFKAGKAKKAAALSAAAAAAPAVTKI